MSILFTELTGSRDGVGRQLEVFCKHHDVKFVSHTYYTVGAGSITTMRQELSVLVGYEEKEENTND